MMSLFPNLLFLGPLGTTLIRILAGCLFLYMAWRTYESRDALRQARIPLIGHPTNAMAYVAAIFDLVVGFLLVIGMWTQAAALVGALIALKHLILSRSYARLLPLSASAYVLLAAVCIALIVMGAGLFAVDLPL